MHSRPLPSLVLAAIVAAAGACATAKPASSPVADAPPILPPEVQEIVYPSDADGSEQPALFLAPTDKGAPAPLLVGLHTWSHDWKQLPHAAHYARFCIANGWAFIHPNFRGPNRHPDAAGSELAVADIKSAVAYARARANIDAGRIYVVGESGGGYAALLMAGRAPELWRAVSAWVPIVDLVRWHRETRARNLHYSAEIEAVCGGNPQDDEQARRECLRRSVVSYIDRAHGLALDINAGIHDGHDGNSVPISHAIEAWNRLADPAERLSDADVQRLTETAQVPDRLRTNIVDPAYGDKRVLLRRQSGSARLTLFEGGHEIIFPAALDWLSRQR